MYYQEDNLIKIDKIDVQDNKDNKDKEEGEDLKVKEDLIEEVIV